MSSDDAVDGSHPMASELRPSTAVRCAVLVSSAFGLIEGLLVAWQVCLDGIPVKIFHAVFLISLAVRIMWRGDKTASSWWWPVELVLFTWVIKDTWMYRPRDDKLKKAVTRIAISKIKKEVKNPFKLYRRIKMVQQWARWIKWLQPIHGAIGKFNGVLKRWRVMRKQRRDRAAKLIVTQTLRKKLSQTETHQTAARRIQAAHRGRFARFWVARQRRSTQLLARWATKRLARGVDRHRMRLQARADSRPLLFRPDSQFIFYWKLAMVGLVLVEMVSVVMEGAEAQKLQHSEKIGNIALRLLWPDCLPRLVAEGPRSLKTLGGRTLVAATLPEHCENGRWAIALLGGYSPLGLLLGIIGTVVETLAVADTFIEYFIGVLHPTTGVLMHKSLFRRYLKPPFSLGFNVLVNPALPTFNRCARRLLLADNSNHFWRFVFMFQPFRKCAEEWLTPRIRAAMRLRAESFNSSRAAALETRLVRSHSHPVDEAVHAAAEFAKAEEQSPRRTPKKLPSRVMGP